MFNLPKDGAALGQGVYVAADGKISAWLAWSEADDEDTSVLVKINC